MSSRRSDPAIQSRAAGRMCFEWPRPKPPTAQAARSRSTPSVRQSRALSRWGRVSASLQDSNRPLWRKSRTRTQVRPPRRGGQTRSRVRWTTDAARFRVPVSGQRRMAERMETRPLQRFSYFTRASQSPAWPTEKGSRDGRDRAPDRARSAQAHQTDLAMSRWTCAVARASTADFRYDSTRRSQ